MLNSLTRTSLALLLSCSVAFADVVCDGSNDYLRTGSAITSDVMSASTGTFMIWYKPTGTPSDTGTGNCGQGELIMGDTDTFYGLYRHGNIGGGDKLCSKNYDGSDDTVLSNYTTDAWTHLAWVHGGGNLFLYKDGVSIGSTASGDVGYVGGFISVCGDTGAGTAQGEGSVANPRMFSTALSAAEIESIGKSRLHRIGISAASAEWDLSTCGDGASCSSIVFDDRSGNGRTLTAGPSSEGPTGAASAFLTYPWGVE